MQTTPTILWQNVNLYQHKHVDYISVNQNSTPKCVPTQMKLFDEYILLVLSVLVLKSVHTLQTKSKGVTTQMKAFDEYILMVLSVLVLKSVHTFQTKPKCVPTPKKPFHECIPMFL